MELVSASASPTTASPAYPRLYKARNPRKTPLYRLFEAHYEEVKALWEQRFERTYGRWRGFVDTVVFRYLDCGTREGGFARLRCETCHAEVFYLAKGSQDDPEAPSARAQRIETLEFVARVIAQIPQPRRHLLFYYGRYSHVVRGKRAKSQPQSAAADETRPPPAEEPPLSPARRAALRRRWADLIRRVYEVDPLLCERCGGQLRVIGFITEPRIIGKIIEHLEKRDRHHSRAPPPARPVSVS